MKSLDLDYSATPNKHGHDVFAGQGVRQSCLVQAPATESGLYPTHAGPRELYSDRSNVRRRALAPEGVAFPFLGLAVPERYLRHRG